MVFAVEGLRLFSVLLYRLDRGYSWNRGHAYVRASVNPSIVDKAFAISSRACIVLLAVHVFFQKNDSPNRSSSLLYDDIRKSVTHFHGNSEKIFPKFLPECVKKRGRFRT
jgi:hypothetical protein